MTNDPKNSKPDPDLRTRAVDYRRKNWVAWIAAVGLIAIGAFALTQWSNGPDTDPETTASTNSEPAPAPATPAAPTDNNAAPAPVTPPAGTTQQ
ncbi:hypothetical protein [Rhizobium sp. 007]|uniref:hypothetical protein n=1 Tax=Rhizobium sp. 007 TaxID=2785056 RepID=UPI001890794D|nr:hypothetical protein [Rhizobium sp. 007]QPB18772.1 hypothetical protein ISN39_14075 [Rhizobium sp. 007]